MTTQNKIKIALKDLNIKATDKQIQQWIDYLKLLEKWNKVYNMTAIKKFDDMLIKHLFDSLSIAKFIKGKSSIDVGSGGGLPAIPLAIFYPNHQFTTVDSVGKKIMFQKNVKKILGLNNLNPVNCRIEALEKQNFDNIISRAFSSIDNFYNLCQHLINENNQMLAMKGPDIEKDNIKKTNLNYQNYNIKVPFLDASRNLVVLTK